MIDTDIKAEFDDVMTSSQLSFNGIDSLELLGNLDHLETPFKFDSRFHEVDEVLNHPNHHWTNHNMAANNHAATQHQDMVALHSTYFDDSLSGTSMVNPNSVMPVHHVYHQQQHAPPSHTPSPVPPVSGQQQQHSLTVNTGYNNPTHLNL